MKRRWGVVWSDAAGSLGGRSSGAGGSRAALPLSRKLEIGTLSVFALLASVLLFLRLGAMGFIDPDEGRYVLVAQEMWRHGSWFRTTLNLAPYPDKPAPFFWLLGVLFHLPGSMEWSARLMSVVPALGTLVLVFRWTRRHFGFLCALASASVLLTAGEFFVLARIVRMDALLTFTVSAALFAAYELMSGSGGRWWALYLWAAFGLLVKGPVAVVLIAAVLAPYAFAVGAPRRLSALRPGRGLGLLGAVAGAWYLPATVSDPGGMKAFIVEHNFGRFLSAQVGHPQPWHFFLWVLPACFMPWSLLMPAAASRAFARVRERSWPHLFLLLWCASTLCFFSLSRAKLAPYVLPMFPPLAILTGDAIAASVERKRKGEPLGALRHAAAVWVAICTAGAAVAAAWAALGPSLTAASLLVLGAVFLVSAAAHMAMLARGREELLPGGIFLTTAVVFLLWAARGPELASEFASLRPGAASVSALPPGTRLYAYKTRGYSLSFYSGRRITQLDTAAKAAALLARPEPRALLIKRRHLARIQHFLSSPAAVWWSGGSARVLLANREPPPGYPRHGLLLPAKRGESLLVASAHGADSHLPDGERKGLRIGLSALANPLRDLARSLAQLGQ